MADSISYSPPYLPPPHSHPSYYPQSHSHHLQPSHGHVHVVAPPPRQEPTQRKRPKYTRSKTGCMTCRVKKIKCDETKPNCMRCTHGQRDCTWPEGVPARKKPAARKEASEGRPSTAGSSEASTPPTREPTPPRRLTSELNLVPPPQSRRSNEPYLQLHPVPSDPDPSRRQLDRISSYSHHSSSSNVLPLIPEPSSYGSRYEQGYSNGSHSSHSSRHALPSTYRSVSHSSMSQWNQSTEAVDSPYYMDRNMVGHGSPNDGHNRYQ